MKKFARALATTRLAALPFAAQADTVSYYSYDNGWYGQNGLHTPSNVNTFTGVGSSYHTRSFYAFDLGNLDNVTVTGASVFFRPNGTYRVNGTTGLRLYNVTTPASAVRGGCGGAAAFNDFGSGVVLGGANVGAGYGSSMPGITMSLTPNAVTLINQAIEASESRFLFGTRIMNTLNTHGDGLWYGSNGTGAARLTLTYEVNAPAIPVPASVPLLLSGLTALGILRRRRG